jgi:hypothetical protein
MAAADSEFRAPHNSSKIQSGWSNGAWREAKGIGSKRGEAISGDTSPLLSQPPGLRRCWSGNSRVPSVAIDENDFKKYLRDLAHGQHHPDEHDWAPDGKAPEPKEPAKASRGVSVGRQHCAESEMAAQNCVIPRQCVYWHRRGPRARPPGPR